MPRMDMGLEPVPLAILDAIRDAFRREHFAVGSPELKKELIGMGMSEAEARAAYQYLEGDVDAPISLIIALARLVRLPLKELVDPDPREFIQVHSEGGGAPAHLYLPNGLKWTRQLQRQSLFYASAPREPQDCCEGITPRQLLFLSRETRNPVLGQRFLIQYEDPLTEIVRLYLGAFDGQMKFGRTMDLADPSVLTIEPNRHSVLAGRVLGALTLFTEPIER